VKVGDLIKIPDCQRGECDDDCGCWFCYNNSSGLGILIEKISENDHPGNQYWSIAFDCGMWRLYQSEVELLGESR